MRKGFALAVVALVLAGVASAAAKPTIKLMRETDPMVVKGTGFRAKEKIKIVVKIAEPAATWRRAAVATRTGSFRAVIGLVQPGRCGYSIRATGSRGSVATLKLPPLATCMP